MIIKNKAALAITEERSIVLDIIEAGISRVLPSEVIHSALKYDRSQRKLIVCGNEYKIANGRVFVIGGGKASGLMAQTLEEIIGPENLTAGVVTCKSDVSQTRKIKVVPAGHPIPDERGINGVIQMLDLKDRYSVGKDDLVLCLISGGGSALMPYPEFGITLHDKQAVTRLMLSSGAEINEINVVRKHLSQIKGGKLGRKFSPATVISLILSDVIGNDLSIIASGPTVPDPSTFATAYQILGKYDLISKIPDTVRVLIQKGCQGLVAETPKVLENCHNYIIGDNTLALEAMALKATELGCHPCLITAEQKGDTAKVAQLRARQVMEAGTDKYDVFLLGGETTLKVPESAGRGGRNQHYAAVTLLAMKDFSKKWVVASIGTDGSDYLPDVAGAIVENNSLDTLRARHIETQEYIVNCDSNMLLDKIGDSLIMTGNTGTNVGDVVVYLIK